jgi:hypothetical protein
MVQRDETVTGAADEAALRQVDLEQARLVQAGDADGIAALLHPTYRAHLTNGRILDHAEMLALVRDGSLARERFERTPKAVILSGSTGVVMGLDRLEAPPIFAEGGERTRHYTNIYVHDGARWRLLARHFHLLP